MLKYKWFWIFKGANNVKCTFQEGEWEWKIAGIRLVYTTSKHTKYIFIDWNVITFWNWILFSLLLLLLSKSEFWIAENRTRVEAKMWNFFFIVQRYSLFYDLNLIFACVHLTHSYLYESAPNRKVTKIMIFCSARRWNSRYVWNLIRFFFIKHMREREKETSSLFVWKNKINERIFNGKI